MKIWSQKMLRKDIWAEPAGPSRRGRAGGAEPAGLSRRGRASGDGQKSVAALLRIAGQDHLARRGTATGPDKGCLDGAGQVSVAVN